MKSINKTTTIITIHIILYTVISCGHQDITKTTRENISERITALTPNGWTLSDRVLRFTPENLYEQINGRAEYYIAFDAIELWFASFEKIGRNDHFIDLSIYNMGTPTNAFGVFSGERSIDAPPLDFGRAAYQSSANCYIWKGQYYIQIIASDDTPELRQICLDLARQTTDFLVETGEPVWGLNALPKDGLIQNSIQYFLTDALGLDFMRNTYTAQYKIDNGPVSVFLSRLDSQESIQSVIDQYAAYAKQYGKKVERLAINGVELIICDMGSYYDIIFQKGFCLAGVTSVEKRGQALRAAIILWKQLDNG